MKSYRRLFFLLTPYKKTFGGAILAMVIYGATDGIIPFLIKNILDDIFGKRDEQMLYLLPAALVVFAIFRGAASFFQHYLTGKVGLLIVRDLRNHIHKKLLTLSPSFFERHASGSLISRITNDSLLVRIAVTESGAAVLRDAVRVVALIGAALTLDPVLGAVVVLGFPLGFLPIIKFGKKVRRLSRSGHDQLGGLTTVLQESIGGHKVVQSFCRAEFEHARFEAENDKLTTTLKRAERYGALSAPINEVFASAAVAGVILYGGMTVIGGTRTQGDFMAFITSMFLLYDPLKKLGRVNNLFQNGMAAADRIFEILDAEPEIKTLPGATTLVVNNPSIEYNGVSFTYGASLAETATESAAQERTLDNISLTVRSGETLALVGMSGGGKSTIINLLPRFYDPQHGTIRIAGQDIRHVTLNSLRESIGIVSQHTFLFNDSVYNNILYGNLAATPNEVRAAAAAAHALEFIERLPEGFHTTIGEQGLRLSGGERARIAIARALLKNAPILVLDEATASLDSESEELVQDAIERLMEGRTVLVIAHRLATVRKAHQIAVVVHGRIVETGAHEELLRKGGEYAKLYRLQFRDEDTQPFQVQHAG